MVNGIEWAHIKHYKTIKWHVYLRCNNNNNNNI